MHGDTGFFRLADVLLFFCVLSAVRRVQRYVGHHRHHHATYCLPSIIIPPSYNEGLCFSATHFLVDIVRDTMMKSRANELKIHHSAKR